MQIPETPDQIEKLDLLIRLDDYSNGRRTYLENEVPLEGEACRACKKLYTDLLRLSELIEPLLDRVNARELDVFTMHDAKHARKVAHLMWHILTEKQRQSVTPPEIGLMVSSAYIHDLGMFISPDEREVLLKPESNLWMILDETAQAHYRELQKRIQENHQDSEELQHLEHQLFQAQEAILCRYIREDHASSERYNAIIDYLMEKHQMSPTAIPDINNCLSFDGFSYKTKMIEICISHNEAETALISQNTRMSGRAAHRFSRNYPVGSSSADLLMVACALRLADILDFDRERTPDVIYRYFLPGIVEIDTNRSVLEWEKHLSISNWSIQPEEIVFNARCSNYIVHHAVVEFCNEIEKTVSATKQICNMREPEYWPFILPTTVKPNIHAEGYSYLPYGFTLDDKRVYELLMGNAIYKNPLDAVRELVQNSVDACKLRDALTESTSSAVIPNKDDRIVVEYFEANKEQPHPILKVIDSGTGMDEWILTNCFLKVGSSYYKTKEFNKNRVMLQKTGNDFAPVSDFGIGFFSCFLLGDQIQVETAMWERIREDTKYRRLSINGPSRLIHLKEEPGAGIPRFSGTCISIYLLRGSHSDPQLPPSYEEVYKYLESVCFCLPYSITVKHILSTGESERNVIEPRDLIVDSPHHYRDVSVQITVNDSETGISGEIVISNPKEARKKEQELVADSAIGKKYDMGQAFLNYINLEQSDLIRGGFRIGSVPGLPETYVDGFVSSAVLSIGWKEQSNKRYPSTNLSRSALASEKGVEMAIERIWLSWLIENALKLPNGFIRDIAIFGRRNFWNYGWMEKYSCMSIFQLAENGWYGYLKGLMDFSDLTYKSWRRSTGSSLPLGCTQRNLYRILLDRVLPRVCTLSVGKHGSYVSPPKVGWRKILKKSKDFISRPVTWGHFVAYEDEVKHLLLYTSPDGVCKLNENYKERLSDVFNDSELSELTKGLQLLIDARQRRQIALSTDSVHIVRRAQETFGELEVGSEHKTWSIDSFSV